MQQLVALWQALDTRRRVIVAGATVAMFAAVLMLSGLSGGRPSMALLYAGLEGRGAAEVIAALDARTVPYEVRGDAIYVPVTERDSLRMALAGEGLPATGGAGYELLDKLSGFGTTAQMFDAAYWRAKEGELARTIVASTLIRSARVHIAVPNGQPFRQNRRPTASVAVTTGAGTLPPAHARALKFLVASAVAGMTPEDVSVIDADSGTVIAGDDGTPAQGGEDRATAIKRNVERLLEARVGLGRAVVEVSVETVTEREAITERRFDPQGRVAISTETEERSNSAKDTKPGSVTVASNLPEGAGAGGEIRKAPRARPASAPISKCPRPHAKCCATPARSAG
ncbi:flagellar basal-body MS-ring/collar protein FliF [Frigidibacter albus]